MSDFKDMTDMKVNRFYSCKPNLTWIYQQIKLYIYLKQEYNIINDLGKNVTKPLVCI